MRKEYDDELVFLTKSNLVQEKFDYLSAARLDALISIPREKDYFFLYLLDESTPMFALTHQIAKVLSYKKAGTWQATTHNPFPTIILICRTKQHETTLRRRLRYLCREYDVEVNVVTVQLAHIEEFSFAWHQKFESK